jgi:glutamate dehydrogenase
MGMYEDSLACVGEDPHQLSELVRAGQALIATKYSGDPDFSEFFRAYINGFAWEDLQSRKIEDICGLAFSWWNWIQRYGPDDVKLKLYNPELDGDGWLSPHTVVTVLQADMPFLVESLSLEFERRGITIHTARSTLIRAHRKRGQLQQWRFDQLGCSDGTQVEALIYFEIDRLSDTEELRSLNTALKAVLERVQLVAEDRHQGFARLAEVAAEYQMLAIEHSGDNGKQDGLCEALEESAAFLQWLAAGNFILLGSCDYRLLRDQGNTSLQEQTEQRLGLLRKVNRREPYREHQWNHGVTQLYGSETPLAFAKSARRAGVKEDRFSHYVVAKRFDAQGVVVGESRFLGLYHSSVNHSDPEVIPVIRQKIQAVIQHRGALQDSYEHRRFRQLANTFPRSELFQASVVELFQALNLVSRLNERRQVRFLHRFDPFGKYLSCLVYTPRDLYSTDLRQTIQRFLQRDLDLQESDFNAYFSDSNFTRLQFIFPLSGGVRPTIDTRKLEQSLTELTRRWSDVLQDLLRESKGEEQGSRLFRRYAEGFSASYRDHFPPRVAVADLNLLQSLSDDSPLQMQVYRPPGAQEGQLRFKVFSLGEALELSAVVPILEHLGLRVMGEHPYCIGAEQKAWLHDFSLLINNGAEVDIPSVRQPFQEAFNAIVSGSADNDGFNRLVLGARLSWREVTLLRAYARYMKQLLMPFGINYIADTLVRHPDITRHLVALFKARLDPRVNKTGVHEPERALRIRENILQAVEAVTSLDQDRVIRRYLALIDATVRTNFFQRDQQGEAKGYLSLKLCPSELDDIPEPKPQFEIFVHSPRVEGVHMRGGKVARGGVRWSDRSQDYRTELLGLLKAQQVKNAVIVPTGAKGVFVSRRQAALQDRHSIQAEGVDCYKLFISGLLDVTDNYQGGEVVPPADVVRRDGDDPYLVVAADKGTASFSDIANDIAVARGFWLGDAFASGGRWGYDHKGMGITARGAWVAVRRHFLELGQDIQQQPFTVVGIGDMSGDVFGNGMLLSPCIRLQAAFNHQHIFIDPSPDAARSFAERERMFEMPHSSWSDYDTQLISKGGGVFSRQSKSIAITAEMREQLGISGVRLSPHELIHQLLMAPVDLIWNGGVGTYVKASHQNHESAGDKANDAVRINGDQLRCRVFGEGGNLGLTQLGRIEFNRQGGFCNTDFIDNAAGVDCSDHEVNIKIVLDGLVDSGDLTLKQRNQMLVDMTDSVSELVLRNNHQQAQAISLERARCERNSEDFLTLIGSLEQKGVLNRVIEHIGTDNALRDRFNNRESLTRPELSTLISLAKVDLKRQLINADFVDQQSLLPILESAFPQSLVESFPRAVHQHQLRREIIVNQLVNNIVNCMGATFFGRLEQTSPVPLGRKVQAYRDAERLLGFRQVWSKTERLDNGISEAHRLSLLEALSQRQMQATQWLLANPLVNPEDGGFVEAIGRLEAFIDPAEQELQQLQDSGCPAELVSVLSHSVPTPMVLGLAYWMRDHKDQTRLGLALTLGRSLGIPELLERLISMEIANHWQAMARDTFVHQLESNFRQLLNVVIEQPAKASEAQKSAVLQRVESMTRDWQGMLEDIGNAASLDFALLSVACQRFAELALRLQSEAA